MLAMVVLAFALPFVMKSSVSSGIVNRLRAMTFDEDLIERSELLRADRTAWTAPGSDVGRQAEAISDRSRQALDAKFPDNARMPVTETAFMPEDVVAIYVSLSWHAREALSLVSKATNLLAQAETLIERDRVAATLRTLEAKKLMAEAEKHREVKDAGVVALLAWKESGNQDARKMAVLCCQIIEVKWPRWAASRGKTQGSSH